MEWEIHKGAKQWTLHLGLGASINIVEGWGDLAGNWHIIYTLPGAKQHIGKLSKLDAPDPETAQKIAYARYMLGVYK